MGITTKRLRERWQLRMGKRFDCMLLMLGALFVDVLPIFFGFDRSIRGPGTAAGVHLKSQPHHQHRYSACIGGGVLFGCMYMYRSSTICLIIEAL
jgi:hypothetical protein